MNAPAQQPNEPTSGVTLHLSPALLVGLVVLIAATVWGAYLFSRPGKPSPLAQPSTTEAPVRSSQADGPWGQLKGVYFHIERPDHFLTIAQPFTEKARWLFEKQSRAEVEALFDRAGVGPTQKAALLDPARCKETVDGLEILPDHRLLLELSKTARETIYPVLARSPLNPRHHSPSCFMERWLMDRSQTNGLSLATLELASRFLYHQGTTVCFSDLPALFDAITDPLERRNLMKSISRTPALLVTLHLDSESDMERIIAYWSLGWHAKDLAPFIHSIARSSAGNAVDIVHLLPPFARERLNTYAYPQLGSNDDKPNCYWTALNFANASPDPTLTKRENAVARLAAEYYPITDKPTFGDVICLTNPAGEIFHMANHIAANIAFTKNGYHHHNPWVLMTISDIAAHYPSQHPISTLIYRRKDQGHITTK